MLPPTWFRSPFVTVLADNHLLDVLEAKGIAWPNPSMWRTPALANTSLSTSNFHPDEGTQSHAHSPRRQAMRQNLQAFGGVNGFAGPALRRAFQPDQSAFLGRMGFPTGPPSVPCGTTGSIGMAQDPLNDVTYYNNWTMPTSFPNDFMGGKSTWSAPGFNTTGMSGNCSGMVQMDNVPQTDAFAPFQGEPMHISGPSLEDDEPMPTANLHTKVPTNTPTEGSAVDTGGATASTSFPLGSNVSSFITPDFAHSLTHSLLNQPLPIQPQNIPLPASEVKSRKERDSRFLTIHGSNPASASSTPQGPHHDIRKFSQPLFNSASSIFNTTTSSTSPASAALPSATASRNPSNTDFGSNVATAGTAGTPIPLRNSSAASVNAAVQSSSRKRTRNFTPASVKAIDDEDQPMRPSPHMRASFTILDDESDQ